MGCVEIEARVRAKGTHVKDQRHARTEHNIASGVLVSERRSGTQRTLGHYLTQPRPAHSF